MGYENKCQWTSCPDPVPTPAPTQPTVSPTPTPSPSCKMIEAQVPAGKRCKGKPVGGWGELGKGMSARDCQQACTKEESCTFAVHKKGVCYHPHAEPCMSCSLSQSGPYSRRRNLWVLEPLSNSLQSNFGEGWQHHHSLLCRLVCLRTELG